MGRPYRRANNREIGGGFTPTSTRKAQQRELCWLVTVFQSSRFFDHCQSLSLFCGPSSFSCIKYLHLQPPFSSSNTSQKSLFTSQAQVHLQHLSPTSRPSALTQVILQHALRRWRLQPRRTSPHQLPVRRGRCSGNNDGLCRASLLRTRALSTGSLEPL